MRANYNKDIKEIISLSKCIDCSSVDHNTCFQRFIEETKYPSLNERAVFITDSLRKNKQLQHAFDRISTICNDSVCLCNECPIKKYCNSYINKAILQQSKKSPCIVDLFCGAGGLSLGFILEGFSVALANDIEPCCIDTYSHNHPEVPRDHVIQGDINDVIRDLHTLLHDVSVDVVVGGPPCQGFSMANRQRIIDDPRNHLYKSFVKAVDSIHPLFFVMENVKGMSSVAQQVVEDFSGIGYQTTCRVLNAKDYGVPQNRERLIFIGNRIGVDNEVLFNELSDISRSTTHFVLDDALYGLRSLRAAATKNATEKETKISGYIIEPDPIKKVNSYINIINQEKNIPFVANHKARFNNKRDIEIFRRLNPGEKSDDPKIADIMPYHRRSGIFKDKYYKLQPDRICKTITAHMKYDCNMYIHPTQARGLTPREAARVQSYPDDYFFRGPYTKTYMQIGNSVPPLLGRAIASVIKRHLHNE